MPAPVAILQEQVGTLAENIFYGMHDVTDQTLFELAAKAATTLGYSADVDVQPKTTLVGGARRDAQYLPGGDSYSPEDHLRGLTGLIFDAPELKPKTRASLLGQVAEICTTRSFEDGSFSPTYPRTGVMGKIKAHGIIRDELNARCNNALYGRVVDLSTVKRAVGTDAALVAEWHPVHRWAVMAGVGLTGVAAAVSLVRKHSDR